MGEDVADGGEEFGGGGGLDDVGGGAGVEHGADELGVGVHGEGDDADFGVGFEDAACGLDAVEVGHVDIHNDDVGAEVPGEFDGVAAGGGFADDFEIGVGGEDGAEAVADEGVVVGEEEGGAHGEFSGPRQS